jgi:hypothetical protein
MEILQIQNESDRKRLSIFSIAGAYDGKDYEGAYEGLRNLCLERPYSVSVWALLMRTSFLSSKDDTKTLKFAVGGLYLVLSNRCIYTLCTSYI